jgi:hypothetical protein
MRISSQRIAITKEKSGHELGELLPTSLFFQKVVVTDDTGNTPCPAANKALRNVRKEKNQ